MADGRPGGLALVLEAPSQEQGVPYFRQKTFGQISEH